MPDVIADAVALRRDLGERFLWVDRLCIVQDDQDSKPGQISAMDRIYRSATFTIVAALNTPDLVIRDPRSGPDHIAGDVEAQGFDAASNIGSVVDTSLWNKRGWTFQERLLSRRRIFITEYQVIYECCEGQATELLTWDHSTMYGSPASPSSQVQSSDYLPVQDEETSSNNRQAAEAAGFYADSSYISNSYVVKEAVSIRDYYVWVKDYSSRQLSFGTDILNACLGVGNALGAAFDSRMLYGLPEKHFTQCLLWSALGVTYPRSETHGIPSWSRASRLNPVHYDWHCDDHDKYFLKIASLVCFYYQDPDLQSLGRLDIQEIWILHEISIEELSKRGELPALVGKHIPGEWRTNRDWRDCPHNPWQIFAHQDMGQDNCKIAAMFPGSLIFNTTVASLLIDHLQHNTDGMPAKYLLGKTIPSLKGGLSQCGYLMLCWSIGCPASHLSLEESPWVL
ncbi:heterokaryon incompatibility protein-domain-containing protein [Annulohypoxylon moriforme]|nr:heterokaryon incompatibility protein-domain-containing protein [Annulohypoxylon moriforme]